MQARDRLTAAEVLDLLRQAVQGTAGGVFAGQALEALIERVEGRQ